MDGIYLNAGNAAKQQDTSISEREGSGIMLAVNLPYDIGTLVRLKVEPFGIASISGYCVFSETEYTVFVSGYKEPWCGEYLPSEIEPIREQTDGIRVQKDD